MSASRDFFDRDDWRHRMAQIVATMREMSLQVDPQEMVRAYGARIRLLLPADRWISLSRRDLDPPRYRITRSSTWTASIDPWLEKDRLPLFEGGLLGELIYGDEPRIIEEIQVADDDPAAPYLVGQRSLIAIPLYDRGTALNMVVLMRELPSGFRPEEFPEWVWLSNLFGMATHNLVLARELKHASEDLKKTYVSLDRELKAVANIQHSLLPRSVPSIPTLELAAHYQTSQWAGGDYYDFFALPNGRWGFLIADVSGHGTPAAVVMAITHSLAHGLQGDPEPPGRLLAHINQQLTARYTTDGETFVTAFYGIYDPARRSLTYASAGHNPPRLKRSEDGSVIPLDGAFNLPLGLFADQGYDQHTQSLRPGDQVVFYTDGITEAVDASGQIFGVERLDEVVGAHDLDAPGLIRDVLAALERFTAGLPASDDRTLLVVRVS